MRADGFSETACAILALTTRLAWRMDMPQPLPRSVVRRMLRSGALQGLVLRDTPEIEGKWLDRARILLMRVSDVADGMQAYREADYELLLEGDARWPLQLRTLGEQEPLFLYVKGNSELLQSRMISVAGSRRILARTQAAANATGKRIVQDGATLVTGGASGTDTCSLRGALQVGGGAVIVPAKPAQCVLADKQLGFAFEQGKLLIACDTLPDEPFSAAKALSRNHTIYALGEVSLVVAARLGCGGSWRGASDCLGKGLSPVYVWDGENPDTAGSHALCSLGAGKYSVDIPFDKQFSERIRQTSMFDGG